MFIYLKQAEKCESDAKLVMKWRNDPETLKMFYHSQPKRWGSFYPEFCGEYFKDNDLLPHFALHMSERIAFLRFNKYNDEGLKGRVVDLDINVNREKRGLGLGPKIINRGVSHLFDKGYTTVVAEIKQINTASIRAFEKAGFMYFDSMEKRVEETGKVIPIYRFLRID